MSSHSDPIGDLAAGEWAPLNRIGDVEGAWIEDGKVSYRSADAVIAGLAAFPAGTAIRTELTDARAARLIADRTLLYASQLLCDHLRLLPERDPHDLLLGRVIRGDGHQR